MIINKRNLILTSVILLLWGFFTNCVFGNSQSKTIIVNVRDFGAKGDGLTDNTKSFQQAVTYALVKKADLYIPAGDYVLNSYFPLRNLDNKSLKDCFGITIFGDGIKTVIRTISANGNDVFQLNAVKNLKIRDLSITASITRSQTDRLHGSNAVSITNGGDNITVENLRIFDLPYREFSNYVDGGKGITIQPGKTSLPTKNIILRNNKISGSIYGISIDFNNTGNVPLPKEISLSNNVMTNCLVGFSFGMVGTPPTYDQTQYVIDGNSFDNCKFSSVLVRVSNLRFSNNRINTNSKQKRTKIWGLNANWIYKDRKYSGVYIKGSRDLQIWGNSFKSDLSDSKYVADMYLKDMQLSNEVIRTKNTFNKVDLKKQIVAE